MERFFDIVLSLIAVLVLSPLFLVVMVSLKLSGEGEIFTFSQELEKMGSNLNFLNLPPCSRIVKILALGL